MKREVRKQGLSWEARRGDVQGFRAKRNGWVRVSLAEGEAMDGATG